MAKIPFNIKFRPQIESGEYKVILDCGVEAEILAWDKSGEYPIVCMVQKDGAIPFRVNNNGKAYHFPKGANYSDLFIVTPEPELSEFEKAIKDLVLAIDEGELQELGVFEEENLGAWAIKKAAELLALAREQFIKDGYVIEKKAFHDAVENISDKHRAEMSVEYSIHCKVEDGTRHAIMNWEAFQKVAQKFIEIGKAEALKDLPRWKKATGKERFNERMIVLAGDNDLYCTNYAEEGEYYLPFPILEKLPKEDESHE